ETVLTEFWASENRIGLIWCTQDKSGIAAKELQPTDRERVLAFVDRVSSDPQYNWRDQVPELDQAIPFPPSSLRDVKQVVIVPDSWLSYVPFDLLSVPGNRQRLMIEQYNISYLPSAALLLRSSPPDSRVNSPRTHELVAFGDPLTGQSSSPTQ